MEKNPTGCHVSLNVYRYMKRDDPTIMLIFDDAGYIAGIQISFFKKLANEQFYPFSTADPYQVVWI